jgi:hypothetical protein
MTPIEKKTRTIDASRAGFLAKRRKNNVNLIVGILMIFIFLIFILDSKVNKKIKKENNIETIIQENNYDEWIIDEIIYSDNGYYIIAHNVEIKKLGIKFFEINKPIYIINDTVKDLLKNKK